MSGGQRVISHAVVSIDVDTLASIYKGTGCRRKGGYTYAELETGIQNIIHFFERYECPVTLFMVGADFQRPQNIQPVRDLLSAGHEIGNHSMHHEQGFRFLSSRQKRAEIAAMDEICREKVGVKPVGFRAPGWNIADDTLPILKELGYRYDSSVFPTFLMPALKSSHWLSMKAKPRLDRSTMGQSSYMTAPLLPYRTSAVTLGRRGENGIVEFPISVSPLIRFPFTATFYLLFGERMYSGILNELIRRDLPVHFQFHLSDFVDYTTSEFADQMPGGNQGVYVPKALLLPLETKIKAFQKMMDKIAMHYTFARMDHWSLEI